MGLDPNRLAPGTAALRRTLTHNVRAWSARTSAARSDQTTASPLMDSKRFARASSPWHSSSLDCEPARSPSSSSSIATGSGHGSSATAKPPAAASMAEPPPPARRRARAPTRARRKRAMQRAAVPARVAGTTPQSVTLSRICVASVRVTPTEARLATLRLRPVACAPLASPVRAASTCASLAALSHRSAARHVGARAARSGCLPLLGACRGRAAAFPQALTPVAASQQICRNCGVPTELVEDHAAGDLICKARPPRLRAFARVCFCARGLASFCAAQRALTAVRLARAGVWSGAGVTRDRGDV